MTPRLLRRAAAALLLATAACSDDATGPLPVQNATLTIAAPNGVVYENDAIVLSAVYRDATGSIDPNAPVTWTVSDTLRAELGANGHLTALKAGAVRVTAKSGAITTGYDLVIVRPDVQAVSVYIPVPSLAVGDVSSIGVRSDGPGGRMLLGRLVTLSSDHPNIAIVDASGRVRGVAPGVATIRATVEGVVGTRTVEIVSESVVMPLSKRDGTDIPALIAADTVSWFGVREYHEVYVEFGTLEIWGGSQPRYEIEMRIAEYNVITVNGQRQKQVRLMNTERDYGSFQYDARGDMQMTSGIIYPLSHVGSAIAGGIEVKYRIAGTDEYQFLFFRRQTP